MALKFNSVNAIHIPGVWNIEADKLSRARPQPFGRLFGTPRPSDEFITPFFDLNPSFDSTFSFESEPFVPGFCRRLL